jgi:SAM-dependent methyltransferase
MERSVYEEMFRIEEIYWWFVAKRKIIIHLIKKTLPKTNFNQNKIDICDLGCGCGATLKALGQKYNVWGMDSSDNAVTFCKERGLEIQKGELPFNVPYEESRFDVILMLDVLEHIADDVNTVKKAISLLKPEGIIICTVPAYQWLWSVHDEIHHHKRRYSKKSFSVLFRLPDVVMLRCNYYNILLFPIAMFDRLKSKFSKKKKSVRYNPRIVNTIFEKIFALERYLILRIPLPFGLSLIGVVQRKS